MNTPGARQPAAAQQERGRDSHRFTLARVEGEAHTISTIAEATARTEEQVRNAIRKVRRQNDGVVTWVRLHEVLGV